MKTFDKTDNINIEDIVISNDNSTFPKQKQTKKEKNLEKKENGEKTVDKPEEKNKEEQENSFLEDIVKNDFQEATIVQMEPIDIKKIGIASDHRGYNMKQKLTNYLNQNGYTVVDYGGDGLDGDDYTEFGFKLGQAIKNKEIEKGIAICGSGIGISIACNKVKGVRCAKVTNTKETKWARIDNDANIIAISAKMPTFRAKDIVDVFLTTKFSGQERHQKRINDLNNYKG